MDNKIEHLKLTQGIIDRMARNSFLLKGWTVTLIAGIFALSSKKSDAIYLMIVFIPVFVFWALDAYYLQQERLYIALYKDISLKEESDVNFSMDVSTIKLNDEKLKFIDCFVSMTESFFYVPLAFLAAIIIYISIVHLR